MQVGFRHFLTLKTNFITLISKVCYNVPLAVFSMVNDNISVKTHLRSEKCLLSCIICLHNNNYNPCEYIYDNGEKTQYRYQYI